MPSTPTLTEHFWLSIAKSSVNALRNTSKREAILDKLARVER